MKEQAALALQVAGDSETEFEINRRVRSYISDRVERFVQSTDDETVKEIEKTIAQGVQSGESIAQLRKRLEEVYEEAMGFRSERIARSETIAASNEAALEAYKQSPMVGGQEWFAEPDACEFCQELHGKIIGIESNFANVGQGINGKEGNVLVVDYMDVSHPPLHPNCKCSILPVSVRDFSKAFLVQQEKQYAEMDKRTKEAKELLEKIEAERVKVEGREESGEN